MTRYLLLMLTILSTSHAQWSTDPTQNLIIGYGLDPQVCSDGAGGCYVTYENNISYPTQLVLERINRYGYKTWPSPRFIAGRLPDQGFAKITEDGTGGVLIAFSDDSIPQIGGTFRIRVQRVDSIGTLLWGPTGVRLSVSETNQDQQAVVSDGQGGCIVAWRDTLDEVRVQRIDNAGSRAWGDSGVSLAFSSEKVLLSRSSSFGAIAEYWTGTQFQAQRLSPSGRLLWGSGVRVPTGARVMRCGNDGFAYLLGGKSLGIRNGQALFTLNLQKLDTLGALLWDSLGVTLDTLNTNGFIRIDFALLSSHSTVSWPQQVGGQWELRMQIVRSDGSMAFPLSGRSVSGMSSTKRLTSVLSSDSMSSLFVWQDFRSPRGTYAQRLDTVPNILLDTTDVTVSLPDLAGAQAVTDCNGGLIIVGAREGFSIRAQQMSEYGILGQVVTYVESQTALHNLTRPVLYQNYPNPFNPSTRIHYELPHAGVVRLVVFDILGREVMTLVNEAKAAGRYDANFNMAGLASGVYFYRMQAGSFVSTKRMILMK